MGGIVFGIVVFAIVGVVFVVKGIRLHSSLLAFARRAGVAIGIVREHRLKAFDTPPIPDASTMGAQPLLYPVVEFWTADRRLVVFQDAVGYSLRRHAVGQPVTVEYDPEKPNEARIRGATLPRMGIVFIVVGALLLALAMCAGGIAWLFAG